MPSGQSPLRIGVPALPPIPYPGQTDFYDWVRRLYVELELYFNHMKDQLVDTRGILHIHAQHVSNGFVIKPTAAYIDLTSSASVTSTDPPFMSNGVEGQSVVLTNIGAFNIAVKTPAVKTLAPNQAIFFRWDDTNLRWVQITTV